MCIVEAFGAVEYWDGTSFNHLRYLFAEVLDPVRADPPYEPVISKVTEYWGLSRV